MNLRRTIQPYTGQTLILVAVTVFLVSVSMKTSDWNGMWALAVIWPLFAVAYLYFGLKYRVLWQVPSAPAH